MDTDPDVVSAGEQSARSRGLETVVGSAASNGTLDLTDRAIGAADDAVEARLAAIEDTLDGLAERFEALTRDAAMNAGVRFGALETRLERLHAAVVEGFGAELASLRGDLADALEEVREQVEATVGVANSSIRATLEEHGVAAHTVLEAVQTEVKSGLAEMSRSLTGQFTAIRGVTGTLGGGTERLVGAGQALLAYLGERDRWLEGERDRVLHDVLDDFAQGLSGRRRRALSSRMRDVVDRRRDARDAERFRSSEAGTTVIEIPAIPPELAALSDPLGPASELPAIGSESLAGGASLVKKVAPAQKSSGQRKSTTAKSPAASPAGKKAVPGGSSTAQTRAKKTVVANQAAKRSGGSSTPNRRP